MGKIENEDALELRDFDNDTVQNKIKKLVDGYTKLFPQEFKDFCGDMKTKRDLQENKFSELKQGGSVYRALFEMPETLDTIFEMQLNDEDKVWFKSLAGARWFAKNFKEFNVAEKI